MPERDLRLFSNSETFKQTVKVRETRKFGIAFGIADRGITSPGLSLQFQRHSDMCVIRDLVGSPSKVETDGAILGSPIEQMRASIHA
jgi:hypothetical protein